MIVERLYIKDFMKIKEAEFVLKTGDMIILSGGNAQGKSAVLYAIALLLGGPKKGSSFRNYIRRGQKKFTLKATFRPHPDASPFEAEIVCGANKLVPLKKTLKHEGHTLKNSEYDTYLAKHLDTEILQAVTFNLQADGDLSKYRPHQLRDMLQTVFRLSFDREQEHVRHVARTSREAQRDYTAKAAAYEDSLRTMKQNTIIPMRPPANNLIEEKESICSKLRAEVEELSPTLNHLSELRNTYSLAKERWSAANKMLQSKHKELTDHVEAPLLAERETLAKKERETEQLEKEIEKAEDEESIEESLRCMFALNANLQAQILDRQDKLSLVKEGSCPTCGQTAPPTWVSTADEMKLEVEEARRKSEQTAKAVQEARTKLEAYRQTVRKLTAALSASRSLRSSVQRLEETRSRLLQELEHATSQEETLRRELNKVNQTLAEQENLHKQTTARLSELNKLLTQESAQLLELQQAKRDYDAQRKLLEQSTRNVKSIEASLKDSRDKVSRLQRSATIHEVAERIVDKYLPSFGVLTAGERVVQQMLSIIRPIFPDWELRLVSARDGVAFEYREADEPEWSPISMCSGFEIALCSVAFNLVMTIDYNLPLLILDEVDAAAEDENSYKVFDAISQFRSAYNIYQVWMISHKKDIVAQLTKEFSARTQVFEVIDGAFHPLWLSEKSSTSSSQ